jgi:hypothetical protein
MTLEDLLLKYTDTGSLLTKSGLEEFLYYIKLKNYFPDIIESGLFPIYMRCLTTLFDYTTAGKAIYFWGTISVN